MYICFFFFLRGGRALWTIGKGPKVDANSPNQSPTASRPSLLGGGGGRGAALLHFAYSVLRIGLVKIYVGSRNVIVTV